MEKELELDMKFRNAISHGLLGTDCDLSKDDFDQIVDACSKIALEQRQEVVPHDTVVMGRKQPLLELVRDWDTPLTKYHKGHVNNVEQWAEIVGCCLHDFYSYLSQGVFNDWFRIYNEKRPLISTRRSRC